MRIRHKVLATVLATALMAATLTSCSGGENKTPGATATQPGAATGNSGATRTYYLCSSHQAHPYFADSHIGLRYAAEHFQVNIVAAGPEGWDTTAQAEAIEQAIAKQPAGIISRMWDDSPAEAIKKAMGAGIPVVITETKTDDNPALAYIGLDNQQCGSDTAAELIKRAGESGKLAVMGNWGAANTDAKLAGLKEYLANYPGWEIVVEADDAADTATAIDTAKNVLNNYQVDAIVGLDSSSGTGVSMAMEELGRDPGSIKVIVHDREASTLEYIKAGYIDATLINKTAAMDYLAILLMEDWNNGGLKNVPISSDNAAAGVNPLPENMYMTAAVIDADNVEYFFAEAMPTLDTKLYNY